MPPVGSWGCDCFQLTYMFARTLAARAQLAMALIAMLQHHDSPLPALLTSVKPGKPTERSHRILSATCEAHDRVPSSPARACNQGSMPSNPVATRSGGSMQSKRFVTSANIRILVLNRMCLSSRSRATYPRFMRVTSSHTWCLYCARQCLKSFIASSASAFSHGIHESIRSIARPWANAQLPLEAARRAKKL